MRPSVFFDGIQKYLMYLCRPYGASKYTNNNLPPLTQWATIVLPLMGH
jgi:hypothetical protein